MASETSSPEPVFDMSEIILLYKGDAQKMVVDMRSALGRWDEMTSGGAARQELRRLAHQLRGSGRTYGFYSVTRISKALEKIIQKLDARALSPDERIRKSLSEKIERLADIFNGA